MEKVTGLTESERKALNHLVEFWNAYVSLADTTGVRDTEEVREAVHKIQGVMALRVARRVDPDFWK